MQRSTTKPHAKAPTALEVTCIFRDPCKDDLSAVTGCSISQNSVSVIFRGLLNFSSKMCPRYLNYASIKSICPSVIFRGYLNSASVILIYPRNYRGFRPLCYTLKWHVLTKISISKKYTQFGKLLI